MTKSNQVEDSTRGNAAIRPINYKGDALVQAWIDSRKLAMLSIWLEDGGYRVGKLSEVIKFTINEVVEKVVKNRHKRPRQSGHRRYCRLHRIH